MNKQYRGPQMSFNINGEGEDEMIIRALRRKVMLVSLLVLSACGGGGGGTGRAGVIPCSWGSSTWDGSCTWGS